MKSVRGKYLVAGLIVITIILVNIFITFKISQAAEVKNDYIQLNPAMTMVDNLISMKGRVVTISLISGQTITGIVKDVQNNLLHLEKLNHKEFYDALIRVDHIILIEVRVRQETQ